MKETDIMPEEHKSYGLIGFYRTQHGAPTPLVGSSIKHQNTITLRISTAKRERSFGRTWFSKKHEIIECEMSYTQFAELISGMGNGDGQPVTIRRVNSHAIKDIDPMEYIHEVPEDDIVKTHHTEFKETLGNAFRKADDLINKLTERFKDSRAINKTEREEILSGLIQIQNEIGGNTEFAVTKFEEQMADTVKEGKGEIEAFFGAKKEMLALQAMNAKGDDGISTEKLSVSISGEEQ